MKIVILDAYTVNPGDLSWHPLDNMADLIVYDRTTPDEVVSRCKGAEIVLTNKVVLNAEILNQLPHLTYIGVLATGYNVVDLKVATRQSITVTNIPAYSTQSVAQMTFAHITHSEHYQPCGTLCNRKRTGALDTQQRLLLLRLHSQRTGKQNDGHHQLGKYGHGHSTNSTSIRHESHRLHV